MLKTIVDRLNGHGTEAESLEAALLQVVRDREAARRELSELQVRRHQALLDDATDAALDKIERDLARKETLIEKLDVAEAPLRESLTAALSEARKARWGKLHEAYLTVATEFIAACRAAAAKHAEVVAFRDRAQREGFSAEAVAMMPSTPNVAGNVLIAPDLLGIFERAIAPPMAMLAEQAKPATPAPQPQLLPHQRPRATDSQRGVGLAFSTAARPRPPAVPDDLGPLLPDHVRVITTRPGYQDPSGVQHRTGHRFQLPRNVADAARKSGALEIAVEAPAVPDPVIAERPIP